MERFEACSSQPSPRNTHGQAWCRALVVVGLLFTGCDDDGNEDADEGSETPTTLDPTDDTAGPGGPAFAIVTQVFSANSQTSYALVTNTLAAGVVLDTATAIEIPGRALGFGLTGQGVLYVGGSAGPTIERYLVTDDNALVLDRAVTLVDQGISRIGEYQGQVQLVSPTQAYYFDGGAARAVAWDPMNMVVQGSVDLSALQMADTVLTFSSSPVQVDGRIYMPAAWRSSDNTTIIPESAMVVLDSATGTATIVRDDRCGYAREAVLGTDGFIYIATEAYGSAVQVLAPDNAPEPCMLRFDVAAGVYDPNFHIDLNALTGSPATGSIFPAGPGEAFIRALDPALVDLSMDLHPRVLASTRAWNWLRVGLGDAPTPAAVPHLQPGNGSVFMWSTSIGPVLSEFSNDQSSTQFIHLNDGSFGATAPGLVFSMVQVR